MVTARAFLSPWRACQTLLPADAGAIAVYVDRQGGPHWPGPGTGDLIISLSTGPALRKVVAPVPAGLVVLLAPSAQPVGTVISVSVASAQDWVIAGILGLSGPVGYWAAHVGQLPTAPQLHHPAADDSAVEVRWVTSDNGQDDADE